MNADMINLIAVAAVSVIIGTISTGSVKSSIGLLILFICVSFGVGSGVLEAASALIFVSLAFFLIQFIGWIAIAGAVAVVAVYVMNYM